MHVASKSDEILLAQANINYCVDVISSTILMLALLVTIFIVFYRRRRTDCFIVVAISCYLVAITCRIIYAYYIMLDDLKLTKPWLVYLIMLEKPFYLTAHWAFSAQYLKTCLVLPRLLAEATLEFDEDSTTQNSRLSNRSSGIANYNLLKQMADAIEI